MNSGFVFLIIVIVICFGITMYSDHQKIKEKKLDKNVGTIYVYRDAFGEIQLYLEPSITPLEMSKRRTVSFDVELLDTRK